MAKFGMSFCVTAVLLSLISRGAYAFSGKHKNGKQVYLEDSDIADILNTYNRARSTVFPNASDMQRLVWDEDLAKAADMLSWECSMDSILDKPLDKTPFEVVGTSVLAFHSSRTNYAKEITDMWIDPGYVFYNHESDTCTAKGICKDYKQIIWAKTNAVGCGVSKCRRITNHPLVNRNLLYCLYGPTGNVFGERPYERGVSCSRCMAGQFCKNNLCDDPHCDQEVIIGADDNTIAVVNRSVSTCFICLYQNYTQAKPPIRFYINGIKNMVIPNAEVKHFHHQLYVTNFTSLTKLVDGVYNQFECADGDYSFFRRTLVTLNPVQPELLYAAPEFYEEGTDLKIVCINTNTQFYTGKTYWFSKNELVGEGGDLNIKNISRCQAGLYRCVVKLDNETSMAEMPARSIKVIVYYPPDVVTNIPSLDTFTVDISFTLMVSFSSLPFPSVRWFHNGITLNNMTESINIFTIKSDVSTGFSMLQWEKPSINAVGIFSFVAQNYLGTDRVTITLSLL